MTPDTLGRAAAPELVGTPSDDAPRILATGRTDVTTLFVSMARKDPEGRDTQYLRWHTLDHRPEQQRLRSVRTSLRVVSTPACRSARAAADDAFEAIDHVMTYFFADVAGLEEFNALAIALSDSGRVPFVLPPVQRGVYAVRERIATPAAKAGADVLPWRPARGLYLLIEQGETSASGLIEVRGVAGLWSASAVPTPYSSVGADQQITLCFLDDDPVQTAERLRPVLTRRWESSACRPLLAAPFYSVVPYEWDLYLP